VHVFVCERGCLPHVCVPYARVSARVCT